MFSKKKTPTEARRVRVIQQPTRGPVFSYHANRSVRVGTTARQEAPENPVQKRLPRIMWRKRLPTLMVLLGSLLVLGICLQLSTDAKVIATGPDDSQIFLRDQQVYTVAAQEAFNNPFNRNKLTVDTAKISTDLKKQFPELKVVSVSLPFIGSQPVVYVQPATPKLILLGGGGMYLLDADGRALIPANQVQKLDTLKIPVVSDESNLALQTGKIALPRAAVAFITEVVGQHAAKGISITSMTLPPGANELHVRPEGAGYFVKYNLHGKAREETGAYLAVKARLEADKKTPKEYIDVRVENRAYYK
jgi:hypothetical protein